MKAVPVFVSGARLSDDKQILKSTLRRSVIRVLCAYSSDFSGSGDIYIISGLLV